MDKATIKAKHEEFMERVNALLVEYKDAFAPDVDAMGDPCRCEGDCECKPPENLMATDWFIIVNYQDMDTGGCSVVGAAPAHMLNSHVLGLIEYYKVTRGW